MAKTKTTQLAVSSRVPSGSRDARRKRRAGLVPGTVYGGGQDPLSFEVQARTLRHALAGAGAVVDLSIDGGAPEPVVLKDTQRDVVRGDTVHVDFVRVNLNRAIAAIVPLELEGVDDAPGVKEGGTLEQITRELNIEALPTAIPEAILFDVSNLNINDTLTVGDLIAPEGVTLLDEPEQTVATLTPPRLRDGETPEIEHETALVGEDKAASGDSDASGE